MEEMAKKNLTYEEICREVKLGNLSVNSVINLKIDDEESVELTVLQLAICLDNLEIVDYLVKNGVNLEESTEDCGPALIFAIQLGNFLVVKRLVAAGADINQPKWIPEFSDYDWTPLGIAASINAVKIAKLLIKNGAKVNSYCDDKMAACGYKMPDNVPIHVAAVRGHVEIVKLLINSGADVNLLSDGEEWGNGTPLQAAVAGKNFEIINLLLNHDKIDINAVNDEKKSALHYSLECENCCDKVVKILLDAGADINLGDGEEWLPIDYVKFSHLWKKKRVAKCMEVIKEHAVKLNVAGMYACVRNILAASANSKEYFALRERCKEEVEVMRKKRVYEGGDTLYDLIHDKRKKIKYQLPLYEGMIKYNLSKLSHY